MVGGTVKHLKDGQPLALLGEGKMEIGIVRYTGASSLGAITLAFLL